MAEPHPPHHNTMPELPLDLITSEILPRLPAKSVGRSKSVCKQWRSFLSTQRFATMHCRHITTTANHKLLLVDQRSCSVLDCESPNHGSTTMISTAPLKARPDDVLVLASLDGLVCVCLRKTCELVIWNPITHAYKKLSNSNSQGFYKIGSDAVGFYIDSSNDYRILHIKRRRGAMGVYVYSRRSDSWRKIQFLKKRQYHTNHYVWSSGTFSGGSLYFTVNQYWIGGETMIIGFDVNSETFKEIRFPGVPRGVSYHGNLMDAGNCIHLLVSNGIERNMSIDHWELDLWKMEGDKWKNVASIKYIPSPWTPTFVMSNGKCLVMWDWNRDVYEIDTKKKDYVCVYPGSWFHTLQGVKYIETIVSPNL